MTADSTQPKPEIDDTELVTSELVEFGIRDELDPGYVHLMPEWRTRDDVSAAIFEHHIDGRLVVTRTTTTTQTGWEAAS